MKMEHPNKKLSDKYASFQSRVLKRALRKWGSKNFFPFFVPVHTIYHATPAIFRYYWSFGCLAVICLLFLYIVIEFLVLYNTFGALLCHWEVYDAFFSAYAAFVQDAGTLTPSVELPDAPVESYCTQAESFHEGNRVLEEKKRWEEFGASSDAPTFDDYCAEKVVAPSTLYVLATSVVIIASASATPTALITLPIVTLMMCANILLFPL